MIREKVSLGIEHKANSNHLNEISETTEDRSTHRGLFLEIESQTLGFGSLRAFGA
jgi:hypothetical protein